MNKLIFIFILILGFTSCNSDDDSSNDQDLNEEIQIDYSELIGKWNWMFSCGGITGECGYANEDNIQAIEFKDDLTFIKILNGTIIEETRFSIVEVVVIDSYNYYHIDFENGNSSFNRIEPEIMFISSGEMGSYYERIID